MPAKDKDGLTAAQRKERYAIQLTRSTARFAEFCNYRFSNRLCVQGCQSFARKDSKEGGRGCPEEVTAVGSCMGAHLFYVSRIKPSLNDICPPACECFHHTVLFLAVV